MIVRDNLCALSGGCVAADMHAHPWTA